MRSEQNAQIVELHFTRRITYSRPACLARVMGGQQNGAKNCALV